MLPRAIYNLPSLPADPPLMPENSVLSPLDVDSLRAREFPLPASSAYLNAASVAPTPERARLAVEAYNRRRSQVHELRDRDFEPTLQRCREAAARLIGADADEIALVGNTSFGINLAALSLPLPPGTCVVTSDREFPANVYPWMGLSERGVRLELVPADANGWPDEDRLLERLTRGGVSAFALSAVQFASGYRADLAKFGRICRERGIYFVVDAIQAIGQLPLDVREIGADVLATGGHKWLCGPFGTGFTYLRRELHPLLEPRVVGWTAMQACEDYDSVLDYQWSFREGARKFEVATVAFQDYAGLTESIELLLEIGPERIQAHIQTLLEPLSDHILARPEMEIASDLRPEHRSGIFSFRTPDLQATFASLRSAGVGCVIREGAIRVSPHLYNTEADIGRLIGALCESGR